MKNERIRRQIGLILILLALGTAVYSGYRIYTIKKNIGRAEEYSARILAELELQIPENPAGERKVVENFSDTPMCDVENVSCIGILRIPALDQVWPVAGYGTKDSVLPVHVAGTPDTEEFTISGSGYDVLLRGLREIGLGDLVEFTDVQGYSYTYQVRGIVSGTEEKLSTLDEIEESRNLDAEKDRETESASGKAADTEDSGENISSVQTLPGLSYENSEDSENQPVSRELLLTYRSSRNTVTRIACSRV